MDDFRTRPKQPLNVPKRQPVPAQRPQFSATAPQAQQPQPQQQNVPSVTVPSQTPSVMQSPAAPLLDIDGPKKSTGFGLPAKKSRKWLWWLAIPAVLLVLIIAGAIAGFAWYNDALKAKSTDETPVTIEIESGASIDQVAAELEQKNVIKSAMAFSLYMKFSGKDVIKTGTYFLAPNQNVEEIVSWINDGKVSTRRVTILPGQTIKQIRTTLVKDGFTEQAVDAALSKKYSHKLLADKPANATLEGYIYPETYFVTIDSTPEQLLTRAFDEFEKRIEENDLRTKLEAKGFDVYEGITLASIIAKEVTNQDDQRKVAQVFETRLSRGMMLGSDVTYHYAADQMGVERAVNLDSPYNTRLHTGLPPGPIGNFNLPALLAVANPAEGDFLYFVAGDDGVTHFSRTFEEHEQNIQKYCQKLCAEA